MNRSVKKFLYALLYFGIVSFFGFLIYGLPRLGGKDTALSFPASLPREDQALRVAETEIFRLREVPATFLFGRVRNTSAEYGFRFSYSFSLYGENDALLRTLSGRANVPPFSETFLSRIAESTFSRDVYRVDLSITEADPLPPHEFPLVSFSFPSEPVIEILDEERVIRAKGAMRNEGGTFIPEARVVAILRDEFGFQAFAAETTMLSIRSFSEKQFDVPVPYDADLARRLRAGSAEVFVYPVF